MSFKDRESVLSAPKMTQKYSNIKGGNKNGSNGIEDTAVDE